MTKYFAVLITLSILGCASTPGPPENCEIRVDGECYMSQTEACAAAGCPDNCIILRSYPGQVECTEPAEPDRPVKPVLFVVSGHTELGNTGKKTGYFLSEVAHPWEVLHNADISVAFVSPMGGTVEMDPKSHDLNDPINVKFLASDDAKMLQSTMRPEDVDPTQFSAIFFAGGHGAMWDFPGNEKLASITAQIYESEGIVAAVCHGPAGLVDVKLSDGSYLVAGKKVAAFTDEEEAAVQLTDVVPFLLSTRLTERGAILVPAANFESNVVVDQRVITGQNPASASYLGEELVQMIK